MRLSVRLSPSLALMGTLSVRTGDDHVYEAFIAQDDLAAAVLPSTPRTDAAIESHPISAAAPTSYPHEQHASRPETPSPMDEACDAEPPVTPSSGAFFTRTLALMAPPPPRTNRSPSPVHRPMVQLASPPPSRA